MKRGGHPNNSCGALWSRGRDEEVVELSNYEEVAKGVGPELHIILLYGEVILRGTHDFSDTKEHMNGSFLPAVAQTGSVSEAITDNGNRFTS